MTDAELRETVEALLKECTPEPWEKEETEAGIETTICAEVKCRYRRDNHEAMRQEAEANTDCILLFPTLARAYLDKDAEIEWVIARVKELEGALRGFTENRQTLGFSHPQFIDYFAFPEEVWQTAQAALNKQKEVGK